MVAALTEQLQQMELLAVLASSVSKPSDLTCPPHSCSDDMPFSTSAESTQYSQVCDGDSYCGAAEAPRYQFQSNQAASLSACSFHSRRTSAQQSAPRTRSHVIWRPGTSRVWMVKYRRKMPTSLDPVASKDAWSADSICWKPICKWSSKPKSLSADEATGYSSPFLDSEVTSRRPKSHPCLRTHRSSFGKRSHDEPDSPRPCLSFAKMKKSCSYSGLESLDDGYIAFEPPAESKRISPSYTSSPSAWGADLDVEAIERN